jgi:Lrp/AsnC family leucine-responsive transcriptional regulator
MTYKIELEYGEKFKLDEKDKKIIEQLQLNARQNISEIAKKTNLPRDIVKYRIKRLEQNKLVRQYHAFINPALLGYPLYVYVGFSLLNINPEEENKFISFLKSKKQIIYVAKNSGKWDFSIGVAAKDYNDFDKVLKEVRAEFTKVIKDYEILPVIQEYKYDWMVDLI